jgi:hypothetical protein
VPEPSRFSRNIIRMFAEVGTQHDVPHFHGYYQEEVGIFSIAPVEIIAGSLKGVFTFNSRLSTLDFFSQGFRR